MGHKLLAQFIKDNPDGLSEANGWQDKTQKAFVVPKADLKANKYDLSINRYKEVVYDLNP